MRLINVLSLASVIVAAGAGMSQCTASTRPAQESSQAPAGLSGSIIGAVAGVDDVGCSIDSEEGPITTATPVRLVYNTNDNPTVHGTITGSEVAGEYCRLSFSIPRFPVEGSRSTYLILGARMLAASTQWNGQPRTQDVVITRWGSAAPCGHVYEACPQ